MVAEELAEVLVGLVGDRGFDYVDWPEKLTGGFFTDNYGFRLDAASPWDRALVLRLFPEAVEADQVFREATVQRVLAEQGFPTPRVVYYDGARMLGRDFFIMERLEGGPMIGGIRARDLLTSGWQLLGRLADTSAEVLARLHAVDPSVALEALGETEAGLERWFETMEAAVSAGAAGLQPGLDWLVDNRPAQSSRRVICHGDIHPGNLLFDAGGLTGVLDWTTTTVAEPNFDLGAAVVALSLAPIDAPRPIQRLMARVGRRIASRLVSSYQDATSEPPDGLLYYEALRCANELVFVAEFRLGKNGIPRPTWDSIADDMIRYFQARTGVTLTIPQSPRSPTTHA